MRTSESRSDATTSAPLRFEYWTHTARGERYLVRFDPSGMISGVCGPMRQPQIPAENRPNYDYDCQPRRTEWLRAHAAEFHSLAPSATAATVGLDTDDPRVR